MNGNNFTDTSDTGRLYTWVSTLPVSDSLSSTVENDPNHWASMLKCSVCFDYFTDPRCLPCGHSFCKKCIEEIIEHTKNWRMRRKFVQFPCPHCRYMVLEKNYHRFSPRNVLLESILEGWLQSKERQRAKVKMASESTQTTIASTEVATQTEQFENCSKASCHHVKLDQSHLRPCPQCIETFSSSTDAQNQSNIDLCNDSGDNQPTRLLRDALQNALTPSQCKKNMLGEKVDIKGLIGLTQSFKRKLTLSDKQTSTEINKSDGSTTLRAEEPLPRVNEGNGTNGVNENMVIFKEHKTLDEGVMSNSNAHCNKHEHVLTKKMPANGNSQKEIPSLPGKNIMSSLIGLKPVLDSHFNMAANSAIDMKKDSQGTMNTLEDVLFSLNDHLLPGERIQMGEIEMMGLPSRNPVESDISEILHQLFY